MLRYESLTLPEPTKIATAWVNPRCPKVITAGLGFE